VSNILSEALKEAYAEAPADVVILHTLEIRHSNFIDNNGDPAPIRIVKDYNDLEARLESKAPLNSEEIVTFIGFAFDISLPKIDDTSNPEIIITIDNVSLEILDNIERAVTSKDFIEVTYRPYLSTELDYPHYDPPLHMTLTNITANLHSIKAKASFSNFANLSFPKETYTIAKFPSLGQ